MYHSLEYIIIMSRTFVLTTSWTLYCNVPGKQHNGLCHFNTEEKKKKQKLFPSLALALTLISPNCKHQALLTIWLRATADDCGALRRL